ncbi:DDE_Tnp_IS1595 domain-containing protein [Caerostris darwini]|uniref:DDE_Tnp_IS1595 domain-containing protein n=1 Tax=Caerostris darwini TaxID=1538125 RepID=A0AAV4UY02_9ARAC|nr:DDE_Tnp_IS1595 domain-containing protein [Caerostris darwini]
MHTALKNLHVMDIGGLSEETIIDIFTEGGMLPKKDPVPMCLKCEGQTKASTDNSRKLGWVWWCKNRTKRKCSGKRGSRSMCFLSQQNIRRSRDEKEGLFLIKKGKSKRELWPFIKHHCHPETSIICSDKAKQYVGVQNIFSNAPHNHSIGEFFSPTNPLNTINALENENKHLKDAIISTRSPDHVNQYMGLHFYRRTRMMNIPQDERIHLFMKDASKVNAGYRNENMEKLEITVPDAESEGIGNLCNYTDFI